MPLPDWLQWAQRLQALAQSGLTYASDVYDRERYEQIRQIAVDIIAEHTGIASDTVHDLFSKESGYATPKVDVRGVVFRDGQILLVKEASDGGWTLPGGWADVGDSPAESVEREILEESGYRAKAVKVLAVYDRARHDHPPNIYYIYKIFFRCEITGGSPQTSHETLDVGFFHPDDLPPLSTMRVTAQQIARFYEHLQQPDLPTDFD